MQITTCNTCQKTMNIYNFYVMIQSYIRKKTGEAVTIKYPRKPCKKCTLKNSKDWVGKNRKRSRKSQRMWSYNKRIELLRIMGGKCTCCGVIDFWNLTLDHIKPIRRKNGERFDNTITLLKNPEKQKDFQILCYGCNISKGAYDKCSIDHTLTI